MRRTPLCLARTPTPGQGDKPTKPHVCTEQARGARHARGGRMRAQRTVVVGETIRDTYVSCDRPDVASESPCLSLRPIERASFDGGAAVIALHAAALGAETTLITALPDTAEGEAFTRRMSDADVRVRSPSPHSRSAARVVCRISATSLERRSMSSTSTTFLRNYFFCRTFYFISLFCFCSSWFCMI